MIISLGTDFSESEKVGTKLKGQLDSLGVKVGGEGGIGGIQVDADRLKV